MFKKDVKELVELNYEYEDNSEIMKLTRKVRLVLKTYGKLLGL